LPTYSVGRVTTSERSGPRVTLWLLRCTTAVVTVGVLLQPVLAGGYLSGDFDLLWWHATNASVLMSVALAQIVVAVCFWLIGRGKPWPVLLSVALFFAAGVQTGMGYARVLWVHIPLGVALVLLALGLFAVVFHRSAKVGRPKREGAAALTGELGPPRRLGVFRR